jgi:hypothetical protein
LLDNNCGLAILQILSMLYILVVGLGLFMAEPQVEVLGLL